jgi:hypothetical protein
MKKGITRKILQKIQFDYDEVPDLEFLEGLFLDFVDLINEEIQKVTFSSLEVQKFLTRKNEGQVLDKKELFHFLAAFVDNQDFGYTIDDSSVRSGPLIKIWNISYDSFDGPLFYLSKRFKKITLENKKNLTKQNLLLTLRNFLKTFNAYNQFERNIEQFRREFILFLEPQGEIYGQGIVYSLIKSQGNYLTTYNDSTPLIMTKERRLHLTKCLEALNEYLENLNRMKKFIENHKSLIFAQIK